MPVDARTVYVFRTGRRRRLYLTATFQAQARWLGASGLDGAVVVSLVAPGGYFRLHGGVDTATKEPPVAPDYHGFGVIPPTTMVFRMQVQQPDATWYQVPWGGGDVPSAGRVILGTGGSSPFTMTVTGSFSAYMDVEEWKEITEDARVPRTDYPVEHPEGGTNNVDWLGWMQCLYGEAPREGGAWGWTLTIDGGSSTGNTGVFGAQPEGADATLHVGEIYVGATQATARPGYATVAGGWQWVRLQNEPYGCGDLQQATNMFSAVVAPGTAQHWLISKGGVYVGSPSDRWYMLDTTGAKPAVPVRVRGKTVGMYEQHYDGVNAVRVRRNWQAQLNQADFFTAVNGVHSEDWLLQEFVTELLLNDETVAEWHVDPLPYLRVWLPAVWLNERGEQPQDWRVLLCDDRMFAPVRLRHRATVMLDTLASQDGWVPANANILPGSVLQVETTGAGASVTRTYDPVLPSSEYRFCFLEAMASGGGPCNVQLTSGDGFVYTYQIDISTTWGEFMLDLCAPESAVASSDSTDHGRVAPGEFYGPRTLETIAFAGLANGKVYSFRNLRLARQRNCTYCGTQPNFQANMEWQGSDNIKRWRATVGLADRRQVFDTWYRQQHPVDPLETGFVTLAEWLEQLDSDAYETVTTAVLPGASEAEQFYGDVDDRLAAYIADATVSAGVPSDWVDRLIGARSAGTPPVELALQPLQCCMRFDAVMPYPGIGDPAGSYGGWFPLRYVKRLRMYVHGLVVDPTNARAAPGVQVKLKRNTGVQDSDFTDDQGYYRLGPVRPLATQHIVWTEQTDDVVVPALHTNRHLRWMGLRYETPSEPPSLRSLSCAVEPLTRREVVWACDATERPTTFLVDRPTRATMTVTAVPIEAVAARYPNGVYLPDGRAMVAYTVAGGNRLAVARAPWVDWETSAMATPGVSGYDRAVAPVLVTGVGAGHGIDGVGSREAGRLYAMLFGLAVGHDDGLPLSLPVGAEGQPDEWTGWKTNDVPRTGARVPEQVFCAVRDPAGRLRVFYADSGGIRSYVPVAHRLGWNVGPRDLGGWTEGGSNGEANLVLPGSYRHPAVALEQGGKHWYMVCWLEGVLMLSRLRWLSSADTEHAWSVDGPVPASTKVDVGEVPGVVPEQRVALMVNPAGELRMYWWNGSLHGCTLHTKWG